MPPIALSGLNRDSLSIQETDRFCQGTLRELFLHPIFVGARYQDFRRCVSESEDHYFGLPSVQLDVPIRNELQRLIQEQIAGPLNAIGMTLHHIAQAIGQRESGPSVGPTLTNSTTAATFGSRPLELPLPPNQDTVKVGDAARKKRRRLGQRQVLRAEVVGVNQCPRPNLSGSDSGLQTLAQFWHLYQTKWKPLEDKWGSEWRVDKLFMTSTGQMKKCNSRATWWGTRKPMYDFIEMHIAAGHSERDAISLATAVFESVAKARGGGRALKQISAAFRLKLGVRTKGRPKGSSNGSKRRRTIAVSTADGMAELEATQPE